MNECVAERPHNGFPTSFHEAAGISAEVTSARRYSQFELVARPGQSRISKCVFSSARIPLSSVQLVRQ
jgi:hypothetical protein